MVRLLSLFCIFGFCLQCDTASAAPFALVGRAVSPTLAGDGGSLIAYQSGSTTTTVLDSRNGKRRTYTSPAGCERGKLVALSTTHLLYECNNPERIADVHLLELTTGSDSAVPGIDSVRTTLAECGNCSAYFDRLGRHWLRITFSGGPSRQYVNWRTGQIRSVSARQQGLVDLDSANLISSPCRAVRDLVTAVHSDDQAASVSGLGARIRSGGRVEVRTCSGRDRLVAKLGCSLAIGGPGLVAALSRDRDALTVVNAVALRTRTVGLPEGTRDAIATTSFVYAVTADASAAGRYRILRLRLPRR